MSYDNILWTYDGILKNFKYNLSYDDVDIDIGRQSWPGQDQRAA